MFSDPSAVVLIITPLCLLMLALVLIGGRRHRIEQDRLAVERAANPSLPPPVPRYTTQQARNYRLSYFALLAGFLFVIVIPGFYDWTSEIPNLEGLHETEGNFTYKVTGRHNEDRLMGIITNTGTMYFSCGQGYIAHPDCIHPSSEYDRLVGKPAQVWWYEQSVYLFMTQKRVGRLVVDGEEKVSYEHTVEVTKRTARSTPWLAIIILCIYAFVIVALERNLRKGLKSVP